MSAQTPPRRLIYCVDGTWCGPDGTGPMNCTLTNIYQIYASIQDSTQSRETVYDGYFQEPVYEPGIGSADDTYSMSRIVSGAFGDGYRQQIRNIYERCCTLDGLDDEVWLFGFSRGAFVVRAVAGLLHYLRAISSAGTTDFERDYEAALEVYRAMKRQGKLGPGQIHSYFAAHTRQPPKIKFLGAFDTVKAVNDHSLFDISFNDSIHHLRHALALHEDREAMTPEYVYPDIRASLRDRSFVQAWFIGAHIDMGGSSAKAGLALYPLQWVLLEAQSQGLVLGFAGSFGGRVSIDNPLRLVFPDTEEHGKGAEMWSCELQNGLKIQMQDLRNVHERYGGRYSLKLNKHHATLWAKKSRDIFADDGTLNGWTHFPQGTIVHPSVYLLLDEWVPIALDTEDSKLREHIEHCRKRILGARDRILNPGFWNEGNTHHFDDWGAIRVLVCGNAGVGKSTLINKVFGVRVAGDSDRDRGEHDVRVEIKWKDRPSLIVHDSGGFETGASGELDAITDFLKVKSKEGKIEDRLHVIWLCIELNSTRTMQPATEKLFKAVSTYAQDVPIVVVATKMDEFKAVKFQEKREFLENQGQTVDIAECDRYAEDELHQRTLLMDKEMWNVEGGRLDACVPVSKGNFGSINDLTGITSRFFDNEKIRILYIGAQVTRIDLKIGLAVEEVMTVYKHSVKGAAAVAGFPSGPTTTRTGAAVDVCRMIVKCFGLTAVTGEMAMEVVKSNIWDDIGDNFLVALSEGLAALGMLATVLTGGGPFFLISGAVNIPLTVPATARLLFMLAADMILILARSFKEAASVKSIGQPLPKDLGVAARAYRKFAKEVHKKVKKLVPRRNLIASFRTDQIRIGFGAIIEEYRSWVMDDVIVQGTGSFEESNDEASNIGSDASLIDDMAEARGA